MRPPRDEADAFDWLRLIRSQNVGPATFHDLVARFGTAGAALEALPDLAAAAGAARSPRIAGVGEVEREVRAASGCGARLVFLGTADYPPLLAAIAAPPPVLTVRGEVAALSARAIAVVGARQASTVGLTFARRLAEAFGRAGRVVVSGLALGIDTAAHESTLVSGTVAVIAGGVDNPTPAENVPLAQRIVDAGGAVVSEMPLGTEPIARFFVRRNRLIAGLAEGVVVVEAAERSGSLHTANFATQAGREVFAVPGSPLDPRARGCLQLLREGATLVVEPADVLLALREPPQAFAEDPAPPLGGRPVSSLAARSVSTGDTLAAIAAALSPTPVPVDLIVRATGLPVAAVAGALMELELAGRAEREPDGTVRAVVS